MLRRSRYIDIHLIVCCRECISNMTNPTDESPVCSWIHTLAFLLFSLHLRKLHSSGSLDQWLLSGVGQWKALNLKPGLYFLSVSQLFIFCVFVYFQQQLRSQGFQLLSDRPQGFLLVSLTRTLCPVSLWVTVISCCCLFLCYLFVFCLAFHPFFTRSINYLLNILILNI